MLVARLTFSLPFGVNANGEKPISSPSITPDHSASTSIESKKFAVRGISSTRRVAGQFIVVLKKSTMREYAQRTPSSAPSEFLGSAGLDFSTNYGGSVTRVYGVALDGFVLSDLSDTQAQKLAMDPRVEYVEADLYGTLLQYQSSPRWGLDRIDQRSLPLNNGFFYPNTGAGINVYVIDSGIYANNDFGGRVNSNGGFTAVNDGYGTSDCNGHGTHVAGIVGSYTYGVAKSVNIYPVRVFGCDASSAPISQIISGVNWVATHNVKPAIANMSLTSIGGGSSSLDQATQNLLALGVTVVAAAGNDAGDACQVSPARVPGVITVGGSTDADAMYNLSNFGTCVDIYAPATGIKSTYNTGPTSTAILDGTSMAAPHVAGVVANYLANNPTASPATVSTYLRDSATTRKIVNTAAGVLCQNANALLYNGIPSPSGSPSTPTNLLAERTCNGSYLLTWDYYGKATVDSYEIYQSVNTCESYLTSTTTRLKSVGTLAGQPTRYRVRACNSIGCSGYSQGVSASPYSGCH